MVASTVIKLMTHTFIMHLRLISNRLRVLTRTCLYPNQITLYKHIWTVSFLRTSKLSRHNPPHRRVQILQVHVISHQLLLSRCLRPSTRKKTKSPQCGPAFARNQPRAAFTQLTIRCALTTPIDPW
jgi:hypothetical protein